MTTLLVIIWCILTAVILLVASIKPERTKRSRFELERLHDRDTLRREKLLMDIFAVKQLIVFLGIASIAMLSVVLWQWWGVLMAFIVVVLIAPVARSSVVKRYGNQLYSRWESQLLQYCERHAFIGRLVKNDTHVFRDQKLESHEQLLHLVDAAGTLFSEEQQTIIRQGLKWHSIPVSEVMVPRKKIVSVKHTEMLGPLVLNDLHTTGHTRFPVVKSNIDTIVGVLDIAQLLDVTATKNSQTVEKVMAPQPLRIEKSEPLPNALHMLQKSHGHLLIVVDENGDTVGLVTLTDITAALLGR